MNATPGGSSAAGGANAEACQKVQTDLGALASAQQQMTSDPKQAAGQLGQVASKLEADAATGSPALKSAVGTFAKQLAQAATQLQSGKLNTNQLIGLLTSSAGKIVDACKSS